jgi:hypothetical protein
MDDEFLALAAELRQATDHLKLTINRFAAVGDDWLDVADRLVLGAEIGYPPISLIEYLVAINQ